MAMCILSDLFVSVTLVDLVMVGVPSLWGPRIRMCWVIGPGLAAGLAGIFQDECKLARCAIQLINVIRE